MAFFNIKHLHTFIIQIKVVGYIFVAYFYQPKNRKFQKQEKNVSKFSLKNNLNM